MKADQLLKDIKKGAYHPIYWLEGEEEFFIDEITHFAEHSILKESEASFNLTVMYGRDTDWATVVNACRRYPMFAEKQVVILKEAQAMRDIEKLESYIEKPLSSTLFFVAYKGKKLDGRSKLAKYLKNNAVLFTSKKLYESEMPDWVMRVAKSKGLSLTNKALYLLVDHIGNDLSRISNELEKIQLNLASRKEINEDDIENFVGISKEYNVFELQSALEKKDLYKAIRIANYFQHNPKAGPLQFIFPTLYGFFSRLMMVYHTGNDRSAASAMGLNDWKFKELLAAAGRYSQSSVEKNILLLHEYNLKSLGVNDAGTEDGELLKEMLVKMIRD